MDPHPARTTPGESGFAGELMDRELTPAQMLERLVALPTVSRDSNLQFIEFVQDYLANWGTPAQLVRSACGAKANLYATIGPDVAGGVVLSGHTDVVPVDDQDWHTDPFILAADAGRYYGRGTCDMKGFIAIAPWRWCRA